jgi:polar amino acid transport system substrate-binding protein
MKKILCVIAVLALALAFAGCTTTVSSTEKNPVLASGHPDWAPIMYKDGNNISGIGPNLTRAIFKEMGLNVKIVYAGSWDVVLEKAKHGELDVIVGLYKTEEREEYLCFSEPYATDPVVLFLNENNLFDYNKKEDLVGKKGVATVGDSYGQEIDDFIVAENLNISRVSNPEEAFKRLQDGKVDYFIYSAYAGDRVIAEKKLLGFEKSKIVSSQPFYIGVSKKSKYADRIPEINAALKKQLGQA